MVSENDGVVTVESGDPGLVPRGPGRQIPVGDLLELLGAAFTRGEYSIAEHLENRAPRTTLHNGLPGRS